MAATPEEFADADRACVVAAAGCGKTRLIADAVKVLEGTRQLILTHTHAGVHALRRKLNEVGVRSGQVEISTIDGFALRWAASYPKTSGLAATSPRDDEWSQVRPAAQRILARKLTKDHLSRSFDGVFVDEYQDCTIGQHEMIMAIVEVLPTRVVGDPMQGIFDFRDEDPLVDFDEHLYTTFERLEDLVDPHRWATTNPALGEWLVYARAAIAGGEAVDFNNAPVSVWESDPAVVTARAKELAGADGSVVVIRAQASQAHRFAKGLGGRYQSMEEMECKALFDAVSSLDDATGLERGAILIEFAQSVVSGLGNTGTVGRRMKSYRLGEFPSVPNGQYGPVISSLNSFAESGDAAAGRNALRHLIDASSKTPFRHELLGEMDRTLGYVVFHPELSFAEAAWRVRDVTRRRGRRPWRLSVGRTLLVKGLEYEHAVVMDLSQHDPCPLYVALTRGSQSLSIVQPGAEV